MSKEFPNHTVAMIVLRTFGYVGIFLWIAIIALRYSEGAHSPNAVELAYMVQDVFFPIFFIAGILLQKYEERNQNTEN